MKKKYIEETLFGMELANWMMKMNEPLRARKLTEEEIKKIQSIIFIKNHLLNRWFFMFEI